MKLLRGLLDSAALGDPEGYDNWKTFSQYIKVRDAIIAAITAERESAMAAILDGCPSDGSEAEIILRRAWDRVRIMRSDAEQGDK